MVKFYKPIAKYFLSLTLLVFFILKANDASAFFAIAPSACSTADQTAAGNWSGSNTCATSWALNNGCQFADPEPGSYQDIVDAGCPNRSPLTTDDITRCKFVTMCHTITPNCATINMFQIATYGTCGGYVSNYSEQLYDASCNPVGPAHTSFNDDWTGLTAGATYKVCQSFRMLDCENDDIYPWYQTPAVPVANFSGPTIGTNTTKACAGSPVCFTNNSTGSGLTYTWTFYNGSTTGSAIAGTSTATSPCFTWAVAGTYAVKLRTCGTGGCCVEQVYTVTVTPIPLAVAGVNDATQCVNSNFFTFNSTGSSSGGTTTYSWNWGDGTANGTGAAPSHSYATAGTYNVVLTVTKDGCSATTTVPVTVYAAPTLTNTKTDLTCIGANNGTIDLTVSGGTSPYTYSWINLTTGAVVGTTQDLAALPPDDYQVTVTDANGCQSTRIVTINNSTTACGCPITSAAFTINNSNQCLTGNSFSFTNNRTFVAPATAASLTYLWDFGDGTTSTAMTPPTKTYAAVGTYTVTLTVYHLATPCSLSQQNVVTVYVPPANAGADQQTCPGSGVALAASGAGVGGTYSWSGPGTIVGGNTATPTVTPNVSPADYTVTVTDAAGCSKTDVVRITWAAPTADAGISPQTVCVNTNLNLAATVANVITDTLYRVRTNSNNTRVVINDDIAINTSGAIGSALYPFTGAEVGEVCVRIKHERISQLEVYLVNPCGTRVLLEDQRGGNTLEIGSGASPGPYTYACFSATGLTPITSGSAPFISGPYTPEGDLTTLNGCNTIGNWTIEVDDMNADAREGEAAGEGILGWTLTLQKKDSILPPVYDWSNTTFIGSDSTLATVFNASVQGDYTKYFSVTDSRCTVTDSIKIAVCGCNMFIDSTNNVKIGDGTTSTFTYDLTEPVNCATLAANQFQISYQYAASAPAYSISSVQCVGGTVDPLTGLTTSSSISFTLNRVFAFTDTVIIDVLQPNTVTNRCGDPMNPGKSTGAAVVLPVELIYFNAIPEEDGVVLAWSTANEINNEKFEIERSGDGVNFSQIGTMDGAGNSSDIRNYLFKDMSPASGRNYYRLKNVAYDGSFGYSPIIVVTYSDDKFTLISVVPNPTAGNVQITYNSDDMSNVQLELYDATGRRVFQEKYQPIKGLNGMIIDMSGYTNGLYFLKLHKNGEQLQTKISKYR